MRIASLIAGLVGGFGALALEIKTVIEGLRGGASLPTDPGMRSTLFVMLGVTALIIICGIVGAFLALRKPLLAGILMLVSAALSVPLLPGGTFTAPFLVLGSILAFVSLALRGRTAGRVKA